MKSTERPPLTLQRLIFLLLALLAAPVGSCTSYCKVKECQPSLPAKSATGAMTPAEQFIAAGSRSRLRAGSLHWIKPASRFVAVNSLIADNTVLDAPIPDDCSGTLEAYGWNLLSTLERCAFSGNGSAARGIVSTSTIGPLQDNGGPTRTHALLAGSQAIDSTTSQGCIDDAGNPLSVDQRGEMRVAGVRCDVGAFEYVSVADIIFRNGFDGGM